MLENIDLSKESLRKFGRVMFLCLTSIGLILFIKHKPAFKILWFLGILFLVAAQIYPLSLKHIYRFWMHLGIAIGWINSRIILFIIYYLVITPIGLLAKLFGKDFLSLKTEKDRTSSEINSREGGLFLPAEARSEDEGVADRRELRRGRATKPQAAKTASLPTRDYGRGSNQSYWVKRKILKESKEDYERIF